ncbi:ClpXP protease specificity-enhancing factor [uncultured Thiothrix sp.]|jgi:stringent starvation protein B|uniref:ClpXP protease specificity-enhancing factor n=1 Tax=uncultured Thiothrix sp. TaxID=223185 RepID=UPI00262C0D88|nr:ClpXP protease specificity-enhancing factor [uncultured Thiothrix sp.]HMT93401.1 ClpXP protease specificity-enhancing factor [Thiolinea sp.]
MTPKRPYLLRAFYEWIVDNSMTPYITVDATAEEVSVPRQHVKDGRIVLNISPTAVRDFVMDNDAVSFSARFSGAAFYVYCPIYSVLAIYSRETQEGGSFPPDEYAHLKPVVKAPSLMAVSTTDEDEEAALEASENTSPDEPSPPTKTNKPDSKTRPFLRVVK